MSRDCESCDLSHILKMKKIMCGIKMKSAIFPSHLTHKYTKVVPAHILCVCVCHADSHYRHRPQLKLTHVLSNVLTGLWVASCWLNDFFLGVIKALLANPSGDIASCSLAQRQSQMSQNRQASWLFCTGVH